jgi:hypothetical protein
MKTRNGFVSNSSSSSFIVLYKKEVDEVKLGADLNFGDLVEDYVMRHPNDCCYEIIAHGNEEVANYAKKEWEDVYNVNYYKDILERLVAAPEGSVPLLFDISHHDRAFDILMKVYLDNGYVEIIEKENI